MTSHDTISGRFGDGWLIGPIITVPAGLHHVSFKGIILKRSPEYEILLGGGDDLSAPSCRAIDVSHLIHQDARPIRLLVGRSAWPTGDQLGPCVKVLFWKSVVWKARWWMKRLTS